MLNGKIIINVDRISIIKIENSGISYTVNAELTKPLGWITLFIAETRKKAVEQLKDLIDLKEVESL